LGGIGPKIRTVIQKIRKPVEKVVDKVIDWVVKSGRTLWGKTKKTKPNPS
jgi:hypothetical protein